MLKFLYNIGHAGQAIARFLGLYITTYKPDYVYAERTQTWEPRQRFSSKDSKFFESFCSVAKPVKESGRTLLDYDRLYMLWHAVNYALLHVPEYKNRMKPLPAAEIGSYKGGSAYFLASALKAQLGTEAPMHIFDTFEGHPARLTKADPFHVEGGFGDTNFDEVKAYLSPFKLLEIHKGDVAESIKTLPEMKYGLVHIDVDTYLATLDCLNYFGARLSAGGVMVMDDFNAPNCPGVKKAVTEYLQKNKKIKTGFVQTEQLILFG
jgi:predicted O-methyltransferase YrrM